MVDALEGTQVKLPNPKAIFSYIGLLTMITINPTAVAGFNIQTPHLPDLSIIRGKKFVKAPPNTSPTSEEVTRIFDRLAVDDDNPPSYSRIPLSPEEQDFTTTPYWGLPVPAAAIFAALLERLANDSSGCEDIRLAKNICAILDSQSRDAYPPDQNDGGGGPSSGGAPSGGRGPRSSGGNNQLKRKDAGSKSSPSSKRRKKKARKASGGDGNGDCGEAGGESIRSLPLRLFRNVVFPPGVLSQNGRSKHREIPSSTPTPDDNAPAQLIDACSDNSDFENGRSECCLERNPHFTNRLAIKYIRHKPP